MIKHKNIIDQLQEGQKLALAADANALSEAWVEDYNIPRIVASDIDTLREADEAVSFPSFDTVADAWDVELMQGISASIAREASNHGVRIVSAPSANIKSGSLSRGITEDAFLSGSLVGASLSGIRMAGVAAELGELSIDENDVEYMDTQPNVRAIRECFVRPFNGALERGDCDLLVTSQKKLSGKYEDINSGLIKSIVLNEVAAGRLVVCDRNTPSVCAANCKNGRVLGVGGNLAEFEAAFALYKRLQEGLESGAVSAEEMNNAVLSGEALDIETLDTAVDNVIDFALYCASKVASGGYRNAAEDFSLAKRAYLFSTVLLKNEDNVLPLKSGKRVGIVGAAALRASTVKASQFAEVFARNSMTVGVSFSGSAEGYAVDDATNDELFAQAETVAERSDILLYFITAKNGGEQYSKIMASQLALLDKLSDKCAEIIAIVVDGSKPDMSFDYKCKAVLLSAMDGTGAAEALTDILLGAESPSGKLACSLYDDTIERENEIKSKVRAGKNKVGLFFGYRLYDTSGELVKYPFGFGLSYTRFEYSDAKTDTDGVSFIVTNKGKKRADEVVQIYIGKGNSAVIRPKKTLVGFARVTLEAGEKKEVKIRFFQSSLAVFDSVFGKMLIEKGKYNVYICSSVSDVKLTAKIGVSGDILSPTTEKIDEYIPSKDKTEKNNIKDYRLSGGEKSTFSSRFKVLACVALLFSALGDLALAIIAGGGFDFGRYVLIAIMLVALINLPIVLTLIIVFKKSFQNKRRLKHAKILAAEKLDHWNLAELEKEIPYAKMFFKEVNEEDAAIEEDVDDYKEKKKEKVATTDDFWRYVDETASLSDVCGGFNAFSATKGVALTPNSCKKLFASLASSRLIIIRNKDEGLCRGMASVVSGYFGSRYYEDNARDYRGVGDLMFLPVAFSAEASPSNFALAMKDAEKNPHKIIFATLSGVNMTNINSYFAQMVRYLANPSRTNTMLVKGADGATSTYLIPSNLWIIMCVDGEFENAPTPHFISELAATVFLDMKAVDSTVADFTPVKSLSYETFMFLTDSKYRKLNELDEDNWKKLDRLEGYVNSRIAYEISNKAFMQIESFVSAFLACEGLENEAVDAVISCKLLPEMIDILVKNPSADGSDFADVIEQYFGEENVSECRAVIKAIKPSGTI